MVDKALHVVTHEDDGWAIKREGTANPLSTHSTQKEAISEALDIAHDDESNVVVHRRDGRIREVKSFNEQNGDATQGNQPRPRTKDFVNTPRSSLGSRVRWGAVLAGFFITLTSSLTLTTLGVALGLCLSNVLSAENLGVFAGVWVTLTMLASLFVGGVIISRMTVGEDDILEPSVYGALLWALTFVVVPLVPLAGANIGYGSFMDAPRASASNSNENAISKAELKKAGLNDDQIETVSKMTNSNTMNASNWITGNATEAAWLSFVALLISLGAAVAGAMTGAAMDEEHLLRQRQPATVQNS